MYLSYCLSAFLLSLVQLSGPNCVYSLWHRESALSVLFMIYISSQNLMACIYVRTYIDDFSLKVNLEIPNECTNLFFLWIALL